MSPTSLDLTVGLLGKQVPKKSQTVKWKNGHTTVLPMVCSDTNVNVCEAVDIPIIKFMAEFPISLSTSMNVLHLNKEALGRADIVDVVGTALGSNMPVVIRGVAHDIVDGKLSAAYLDQHFAISPYRPVCIHDVMMRSIDHVHPTISGTIESFFQSMDDPSKIQCILDLPLSQAAMPKSLRNIDHGLVHGWNQTTHSVPIVSKVHPENFTVKAWGMLHHAGFLTYPHHDAEGTSTWVRMEAGAKFWVVFRPKDRWEDRSHIQNIATRLVNFAEHKAWLKQHCDAELITLLAGDMLIQPPCTMHAVYTPIASFATGGHFYHYACMHLTELARYIDVEVADSTTNQALEHALETLRRMVIAIPYLSPQIVLFKRPLLGLCIMATKARQYRAKGSSRRSVCDTETAQPSIDISDVILDYFGSSEWVSGSHILYQGNQFIPGDLVDREDLRRVLTKSLQL
ncbi:hypothetical protein DFJ58DRAFT_736937 [Suillus subalutaceus]|uniref:uncharacterized protein n=1 Tax=Suillus subalutaceus TaxID=48586 RepID=UPI001B875987|nr:uncharacterized protein DFJ58DRAFT_736937 [Suillus subalutaceus]KAG1830502.1 hypothetical protein DFJ58DRAFT_736937 [Suillus subalutaceus]